MLRFLNYVVEAPNYRTDSFFCLPLFWHFCTDGIEKAYGRYLKGDIVGALRHYSMVAALGVSAAEENAATLMEAEPAAARATFVGLRHARASTAGGNSRRVGGMLKGKVGKWVLQKLSRLATRAHATTLDNAPRDAKNKVTAAQRAAPAEAVQLEEPGARVRLSAALRLHRRAAEQGSFLSQRKIADCAAGIPPFVLEYASPATVASLDADAQEPTWEDDVRGRSGGRKGDQAAAGASGEVESEMQGGSASATASSRFGVGTAPLCRRNLTLASEWYWRAVNLVRAPCCLPRAKNVAHLSHPQLRYGTSPSSPAINLPAARGTCTCAGRRRSKAQAWLATA